MKLLLLIFFDQVLGKSLLLNLDARFVESPILHQTAAFFHNLNPEYFWTFISELQNYQRLNLKTIRFEGASPQDELDFVSKFSKNNYGSNVEDALRLELGIQIHSPKIALYETLRKLLPSDLTCENVVFANGAHTCDVPSSFQDADVTLLEEEYLLKNEGVRKTVIFYGVLGSSECSAIHSKLYAEAKAGNINYALRPIASKAHVKNAPPASVQGFGVELAIKNMEYKVLDDTEIVVDEDMMSLTDESEDSEVSGFIFSKLIERRPDLADKLKSFKQVLLEEAGEQEVEAGSLTELGFQTVQAILLASDPLKFMKDVSQNLPNYGSHLAKLKLDLPLKKQIMQIQSELPVAPGANYFSINGQSIRKDQSIYDLTSRIRADSLILDALQRSGLQPQVVRELFSVSMGDSSSQQQILLDLRSKKKGIVWFNNIEKDARYKSMRKSLQGLLMMSFSMRIASVRRNLYQAVIVCDPSDPKILQGLNFIQTQFLEQDAPLQLGILFAANSSPLGTFIANHFAYLKKNHDATKAFEFLFALGEYSEQNPDELTEESVVSIFDKVSSRTSSEMEVEITKLGTTLREKQMKYMKLKGLTKFKNALIFNAQLLDMDELPYTLDRLMGSLLMRTQQMLQQQVYMQMISDKTKFSTYWYEQEGAKKTLNDVIMTLDKGETKVEGYDAVSDNYLVKDENEIALYTIWIVTDVCAHKETLDAIWNLVMDECESGGNFRLARFSNMPCEGETMIPERYKELAKAGTSWIVVNGQYVNVTDDEEMEFSVENIDQITNDFKFKVLEQLRDTIVDDVSASFSDPDDATISGMSNVVAVAMNELLSRNAQVDMDIENSPVFKSDEALRFPSKKGFRVRAIIDPLSKPGQIFTQWIETFQKSFDWDITVILNPKSDYGELPLQRYYRYVFQPEVSFDGGYRTRSEANFQSLPATTVLTLGVVDTPGLWLVESKSAAYDLDNLRFKDVTQDSVRVKFLLQSLLFQGQCFADGSPGAGLQLWLANESTERVTDTVVMQNLGYFQLQANVGLWKVRMAKGHDEIYQFQDGSDSITAVVDSFTSYPHRMQVSKREGKENVDILDDNDEPSIMDKVTGGLLSSFWGGGSEQKEVETIHVMSVASGHLYERFLRIMMLSVIKSTKSPVKFWFIKQFLSPKFKKYVPIFAKKHNCEIELMTYRWPEWLREQTVKQRIIWAYKILFLDVLFPTDLKRVIFVDADQIVRADLMELWEMDLQGAVYGYTPMGSTNEETKGFRFWDQGFWLDALRGKPYHISALYVVDLIKFRKTRAGDTLRGAYDQLTADPGNLANLDQDLPNYLQSRLPIFSLPQDWLWCETWCSMESLETAKTIDLCNNPLTKEPKLAKAKRLVPEWVVFDEQQARDFKEWETMNSEQQKEKSEL